MADTQNQPTQQSGPSSQPLKSVPAPSPMKIRVTVRNRTQVVFDGEVKSVSSKNDTGIFDILPEHSNFISLISSPLIVRKLDGQKQEIPFKNGIIKVKDNAIHCYIDLLVKGTAAPTIPQGNKV